MLWLPARADGRAVAIYPDHFRRAMLFTGPSVREFELVQTGMQFNVGLLTEGSQDEAAARVSAELDTLWHCLGVVPPMLRFTDWQAPSPGVKRRRVRLQYPPEGLTCTF